MLAILILMLVYYNLTKLSKVIFVVHVERRHVLMGGIYVHQSSQSSALLMEIGWNNVTHLTCLTPQKLEQPSYVLTVQLVSHFHARDVQKQKQTENNIFFVETNYKMLWRFFDSSNILKTKKLIPTNKFPYLLRFLLRNQYLTRKWEKMDFVRKLSYFLQGSQN